MKRKYFLRGLGAGILFGAIIMLAAYMTSGSYRMSDDDIIKRAEKLGMVMKETDVIASAGDITTEAITEKTTEATTEKTTEATTEATTESTTEGTTTEATTEATTEEKTTEATTEKEKPDGTKATITVSSGMSSETIAALLEDAGLIDSASEFNSYLVSNGYDSRLEVGSFDLEADMTYEEIAKILIKQP